MKKLLITFLFIASTNILFAYYKAENMIDFLVHSSQVRVRTDRLGVLYGTDNFRFAVGLTGADAFSGVIAHNTGGPDTQVTNNNNTDRKGYDKIVPSVLGAFGYKNDSWGIGVGYEFTWKSQTYMVHSPILTFVALDKNLRANIPVSIGVGQKSYIDGSSLDGTMVVSTTPEIRYYFNNPSFSHFRLYTHYGHATVKKASDKNVSFNKQSIGNELRLYFRVETEELLVEPILRVRYDIALQSSYKNIQDSSDIYDTYFVSAKNFNPNSMPNTGGDNSTIQGGYIASIPDGYFAKDPYRVGVAVPVGLTAKSADENIILYLEPALSFTILNAKEIYSLENTGNGRSSIKHKRTNPFYTFGYVVYAELYIKPIKNLEWYTEIQTGGATVAGDLASQNSSKLVFNGSTGITYFF